MDTILADKLGEKYLYASPALEVIEITIEKGFAESYPVDPTPWDMGTGDYNNWNY